MNLRWCERVDGQGIVEIEFFFLFEGDVILSNHPSAGGSHLPDMTVMTPVHLNDKIVFFVANRAHHADIGSISPGSMPPFSMVFLRAKREREREGN